MGASARIVTAAPELAELLAYSDRRDAELAARTAARAEGFAAGAAQAAAQWQAGYVAACAALKAAQHGLVDVFRGVAETQAARWHVCCRRCRLAGHRTGCRDCQARARVTFGEPMPGDYTGGPVAWLPAARAAA